MKTQDITRLLCCAAIVLLSIHDSGAQPSPTNYRILPEQSTVRWTGYYLFDFGEHSGTVNVGESGLQFDDHDNISGVITIDMTSIRDTDMSYDDGGKDLSEHLMSKDFFDVAQYPRAKIDIIRSEPITDAKQGGPNTRLIANLTLKSITAPLTFYALIDRTTTGLTARGKFKFDRTRWGVEYNSGKIFSEIGDNAISDAIAIDFNIVLQSK